ncbi:MAG TPA: helix-turn-helix domain-containing protein [Candidatus Limnocylindria bacterium]|nr:helix-turn-helix domain-containing protein [Candidatus Limnocylindria bacterium]
MTDQELHKLGEVLRAAREAKGVDLPRVERDTKIRARYLTALETGDYTELPGSVYTKGFLRNYGAYLGLDPEYLVDLYRLESSSPTTERPTVHAPPRPITRRRSRALVVTPGAIAAAVLTVGVAVFIIYLVAEFVTFARTPDLVITDPPGNVGAYEGLEYTIVGTTEPNSRITIDGLRENPSVTADADGRFSIEVALVPGSNVITLVANDPLTGRNSNPVSRTIVVGDGGASPTPGGGLATLTAPEEGATVRGPVEVTGTAAAGAGVSIAATLVEAAEPSFRIVSLTGEEVRIPRRDPSPPHPLSLTADDKGAFSGTVTLAPGTWDLSVTVDGEAEPLVRRVVAAPQAGLHGTLRVRGGTSYLELDEDGDPRRGISGRNAEAGTRVTLSARQSLRIRVGSAGVVRLVINGIDLGAMGDPGDVVEWRITRR